jgi:hypothetical protein
MKKNPRPNTKNFEHGKIIQLMHPTDFTESEPITSKPSIGGLFSAVILTIDKLNLALMFSPSRQQFITCQLNRFV